jgi:hypothetical protein
MIALPPKTHIWIAAGVTDLRRGFDGLSGLAPYTLMSALRTWSDQAMPRVTT